MRKNARKNQQKYVELSLFPKEEKNDNIKNSISSENKEKEYDISVCQRLYSPTNKEYNLADLFERLSKSAFRSRFRLSKKEKDYIKWNIDFFFEKNQTQGLNNFELFAEPISIN